MRFTLPFRLSLCVLFLNCLLNFGFAQDVASNTEPTPEKSAKTDAPEDNFDEMTLDELSAYHTTKMRAYTKRYRAAPTKDEKLAVFKTIPSVQTYKDRLIGLINQKPGSEAGLEVVDWWYRRGGRRQDPDTIARLILKNYSTQLSIRKYVPQIAWGLPLSEAQKRLRTLAEVNSHLAVKAEATYQLHELLRSQASKLETKPTEALTDQIQELRDNIYEQFHNQTGLSGAKYVDLLAAIEFATKLEIGKQVPDIEGIDLDGAPFKLSDYQGKVRVISFWGNW